jgi:glycosyltransferase involved in cell wall biosynthesis
MRVLALEPFYGGSHKAFLDGWIDRSAHDWTLLTLSPRNWKWRMRHASITFTEQITEKFAAGEKWDVLFCSDMLNLAEFVGLAPASIRSLPSVAYFHENQLTYPDRYAKERDFHFAFTNLTTALASTEIWFNTEYHRTTFLDALPAFLRRMPDHAPLSQIDLVREKSRVLEQAIDEMPARPTRKPGPLHILWAARWEHDKQVEPFFDAVGALKDMGFPFRLSVIGEQFEEIPTVFSEARQRFGDEIVQWGYQQSRTDYVTALMEADVLVSTAVHEFFGVTVAEAIAAGVRPLLPRRLTYPELLDLNANQDRDIFFYDGSVKDLTTKLHRLVPLAENNDLWVDYPSGLRDSMDRYLWSNMVPQLDDGLNALVEPCE